MSFIKRNVIRMTSRMTGIDHTIRRMMNTSILGGSTSAPT
jgi:hypothetical protein